MQLPIQGNVKWTNIVVVIKETQFLYFSLCLAHFFDPQLLENHFMVHMICHSNLDIQGHLSYKYALPSQEPTDM